MQCTKSNKKNPNKFFNMNGHFRPLTNNRAGRLYNNAVPSDEENNLINSLDNSNQFKARPLKQWRKQSGDSIYRQTYTNKDPLHNYDTPGGTSVSNENVQCCNDGYPKGYIDNLAIRDNKINSCNAEGLIMDRNTCLMMPGCQSGSAEANAKKRVRFSNNTLQKSCGNTYGSYYQYNIARCKTYNQNLSSLSSCPFGCDISCYKRVSTDEKNAHSKKLDKDKKEDSDLLGVIGPAWTLGEIEPPEGEEDMGTWTAAVYTPEQQKRLSVDKYGKHVSRDYYKTTCCSCGCPDPETLDKDPNAFQLFHRNPTICKNNAITKPSNKKFWNQGAVSSSNRLLRLKVDNVNKAAALTKNAYGPNTSSALKYNGSNAAPYSMKSKYYDPKCC